MDNNRFEYLKKVLKRGYPDPQVLQYFTTDDLQWLFAQVDQPDTYKVVKTKKDVATVILLNEQRYVLENSYKG